MGPYIVLIVVLVALWLCWMARKDEPLHVGTLRASNHPEHRYHYCDLCMKNCLFMHSEKICSKQCAPYCQYKD